MLLIQLTGLSGSGKTTIAYQTKKIIEKGSQKVEVIDGDEYRQHLCKDLSFSKADRQENIRRLGLIGNKFASNNSIAIIAAISPYAEIREELKKYGKHVKVVWVNCDLSTLIKRDTKGLYKKAMLPENHSEKVKDLSGINDIYEIPTNPDCVINTHLENLGSSVSKLISFIESEIKK